MLRCYYMDVSCDCSYEQSQALYALLPEERQVKVKQLKNTDVAKKRVLAGAFLQYGLSLYLHVPMKQISYQYGEFGKPALAGSVMENSSVYANTGKKIDFNLSHSGRYAVLAVDDVPVGIDIESQKKNRIAVAKRCFHSEEYENIIAAQTEEERDRRFLEYWTMKEAYVKRLGKGLHVPLDSFLIQRRENGLSYVEGKLQEPDTYFATGFLEAEYCVSVCSSRQQELNEFGGCDNSLPESLLKISLEDIV